VDPLAAKYPWNSPYSFQENKIGLGRELEGLELDQGAKFIGYFQFTTNLGLTHAEAVEGIAKGYAYGTLAAESIAIFSLGSGLAIPIATEAGISICTNPSAQFATVEAGSFILNIMNPGPDEIAPTIGPGGELGNYVEGAFKSLSRTPIGKWVNESTKGWSKAAKTYQEFITGVKAGKAFEVNGVRFDGIRGNVLVDAKSSYDNFVSKSGEFYDWFKGSESLLDQAKRQLRAADGGKIEWHFKTEKSLNATKELFKKEGVEGIDFVHTPEN